MGFFDWLFGRKKREEELPPIPELGAPEKALPGIAKPEMPELRGIPEAGEAERFPPPARLFERREGPEIGRPGVAAPMAISKRDIEMLSAKLDAIKAMLDSLNQRIANIERIALESEKSIQTPRGYGRYY